MQWRSLTVAIIGFALLVSTAMVDGTMVHADNNAPVVGQLSVECTVRDATGTHSSLESRYTIGGTCSFFSGGDPRPLEAYETAWTANGNHQPNTKATFETLTLIDKTTGSAAGSVISTMQCGADPWRQAPGSPCRFVVRKPSPDPLSGPASVAYDYLSKRATGLPLSIFLSPSQRFVLNKQYQIAMASHQKPGATGPGLSKPPSLLVSPPPSQGQVSTSARSTAPTIVEPYGNGPLIFQGSLRFKASPSPYLSGFSADVEFTYNDAPPNKPYVNKWFTTVSNMIKGVPVPPGVTSTMPGSWKVRARIAAPQVGDWSDYVFFRMASPPVSTPLQGIGSGTGLIRPRGIQEQQAREAEEATTNLKKKKP